MQQRTQRVAELIRASVGSNLVRLFPQSYLTVTQVEVSPDLKYADVWISQLQHDGRNPTQAMAAVEAERHELQQQVANSLKTKFTPKLRLFFDDGISHEQTIDQIIAKL